MTKPDLDTICTDVVAAAARGIASACPVIGGVVSEVVNQLIPQKKLDRVVDFLRYLDGRVSDLDKDLGRVRDRLPDQQGLDLFEESVAQAALALAEQRRRRIANLLARSLTRDQLKYTESKKLLHLLRELNDADILFLVY